MSSLGPITTKHLWYRKRPSSSDHGGWDIWDTHYLDKLGNQYTSVEHVLRCAIAKELGL
jgi:hypothetical protein